MASVECECCGQPTTASDEITIVIDYDCDCGCSDCDTCEECFHECGCGDCEDCGYNEPPVFLCSACEEDPCAGLAWHCNCGRACDGSACPGPGVPER
jgi:hypothetical protein